MGTSLATNNDSPSRILTVSEELFLEYLITKPSIKEASEFAGVTPKAGYDMVRRLKDVIQERTRDHLTMATLRAANVLSDSLDATAATEKGELKIKAAEAILDRSGITKHTNVDVEIKATNGIFLIPTKSVVPPEEPQEPIEGEFHEFTEEDDEGVQPT